MNENAKEKLGLIIITALIVIALVVIAGFAIFNGMNSEAATVVGVIVGGLAAFGKDIIAALRGYSMSAQLSKVTDQLAASTPNGAGVSKDAASAAQDTADAAQEQADAIRGKEAEN